MTDHETESVPATKLWGSEAEGYGIFLACECGTAVEYPGHPDERTETQCSGCGKVWKVRT